MLNPKVSVKIENGQLIYLEHESGGPNQGGHFFELLNGRKVDEFFHAAIIADVQAIQERMEDDTYYTAEELCSEDLWESLSNWNRRVAGMCVADAVLRGWLSFEIKPRPDYRGPLKYKIVR